MFAYMYFQVSFEIVLVSYLFAIVTFLLIKIYRIWTDEVPNTYSYILFVYFTCAAIVMNIVIRITMNVYYPDISSTELPFSSIAVMVCHSICFSAII